MMRSLVSPTSEECEPRTLGRSQNLLFMGRQRTEEPMLDTDPRRNPGKKLLDATMFVKWAIIKLLITMHLAMPADIFTKAVDLETHPKMRNLMTNIPWVYRILSESRPPSGKRGRGAQNLVIKYGTSARDRTRRCGT